MRNILVLLLIGGIAFLGYEFGRRRNDGVDAKTKKSKVAPTPKSKDGKKSDAAIEDLQLDTTGLGDKAAPTPDARVEFADTSVAEAASRLVKALEKRDFTGVEDGAELRDGFPVGSTARYALEVSLAAKEGEDSIDPDASKGLHEAASGLLAANRESAEQAKAMRSRLVDGFVSLVGAGRLGRAIAAVAFRNEFLSGRGGVAAARSWIVAAKELRPDAHAVHLSALLDALTRGRVPVWREREGYELLRDAYVPLQSVLRRVLFNSGGTWKSRHYKVKRGQSLTGIASTVIRNWGIPMSPGLLMKVNGLSSAKSLREGARLRIPTERMHAVVEKSTFSMKVFIGNVLVRLYEVGLGEEDSTPETVFTVSERQLDPQWTNPRTGATYAARHPKNLIGRYFVRLEDGRHSGFGIHGTKDQASIGKNSSMGCIRLRQRDIEDVFSYIPTDTKVRIRR